jgi:hypothetical protein
MVAGVPRSTSVTLKQKRLVPLHFRVVALPLKLSDVLEEELAVVGCARLLQGADTTLTVKHQGLEIGLLAQRGLLLPICKVWQGPSSSRSKLTKFPLEASNIILPL